MGRGGGRVGFVVFVVGWWGGGVLEQHRGVCDGGADGGPGRADGGGGVRGVRDAAEAGAGFDGAVVELGGAGERVGGAVGCDAAGVSDVAEYGGGGDLLGAVDGSGVEHGGRRGDLRGDGADDRGVHGRGGEADPAPRCAGQAGGDGVVVRSG